MKVCPDFLTYKMASLFSRTDLSRTKIRTRKHPKWAKIGHFLRISGIETSDPISPKKIGKMQSRESSLFYPKKNPISIMQVSRILVNHMTQIEEWWYRHGCGLSQPCQKCRKVALWPQIFELRSSFSVVFISSIKLDNSICVILFYWQNCTLTPWHHYASLSPVDCCHGECVKIW